jgi:hypothetical protein
MPPLFRRFKTLLLLTCVIGCRQIAIAQNTPTPAFDAAGVAVFKKNIGPEEFHRLQGRLMELNHDIVTRGILPFKGSSDKLLTGYAYHEFYDWDLYFENLYLSYYGLDDYCFNNFKAFMAVQHPDGFIPRMLKRQNIQMFKPFLAQIAILGSKQRNDDYEWLRAAYYDQLKRYLNRWFAYDNDNNGLPVWDSADASGMDNQTRRAGGMHSYNCEGTDLACYLHRELEAMAFIAGKLGKPDDQKSFQTHASTLAKAVNTILWDEKDGFYYDRNEKTGEPIRIKSVVGFLPLWAGIATPERAKRLVREHLTNEKEFWLKYPVATYAITEPDYYQGRRHGECNWQGTSWIPTDYMVMHGLLRYGFKDVARDLAYRTLKMALDENPTTREFYDADTGKGNGMNPFWGWSSLAYVMPLEYETGYDPSAISTNIKPMMAEDLGILMPKSPY